MSKRRNSCNKDRVNKLWKESPNCHWCNVLTTRVAKDQQRLHPHSATFDHLFHRSEPERHTRIGRNAGVLACYECNQKRGREGHIKSLPAWNRFLIKHKFPIPVWKIRKKIDRIKQRFRFVTKKANWLKRHLKYRLKGVSNQIR